MYVSWSEFLSLCFSEGFDYCWAIIIVTECTCIGTSIDLSNLFCYECPFQCLDILWLVVCAYTSLDRVWFSLSFWRSVVVFGYIVNDCRCIFPSVHTFLSLPLSIWIPLFVFGYIAIDCTWIGTCLDPLFSLSFSLSVLVSGILSLIVRVCVRLLIRIFSLSLSLNMCSSVSLFYHSL